MLEKITDTFSGIIRKIGGKATITEKNIEDAVEEIKTALLDADVNLRVVRRFINATIEEAKGETVLKSVNPGQQFVKIVHDKILSFLGDDKQDLQLKGPDTQSVILFLGLQGSGKTTSAAKLAARLKKEGRKPLLVACDLVRPAAIEQLSVLGTQIEVPVYKEESKNAVQVAKNGLAFAKKNFYDTVIVDTAGRLQIDAEMMNEIIAIKKAINPVETLLVADSMTGQSAVDIAKEFDGSVGLSGVILTKFDSDTRGGAALSLKTITGKPILFIGTGEKIEDLEPFYPERIASRILGMGDIVSLVEKAQETIDAEEAMRLQKKMANESFTLSDMLTQLESFEKMGSIESMLDMLPGLAGKISQEDIDKAGLKKQKAIIQSMTIKERENFRIIGPSRRKRIARGSGTSVGEVNKLLKQFEKTRQTMRKVAKNKGLQSKLMGGGMGNFFG
ncbi:MAG: signal recognition particle protein [Treponema phagedenis]|uniref:Signal recognition particle protein n=1 Tax=Treponema phagedenis TaxID=162 RepID=A0AAE6IUB6_TREPH|nr:signal recognition particle protein [Treponema phagedenis]EFW38821.1 signal recognition particle protein [Treponema phagedenis F0421]QEJ98066.1 signal recognition particle protein [Treponema phagedenis]TYT76533.1 signal recognition particle protein [Treponema phagedenis]TYT77730.1 signal recognition particle protein [Treponema phagedenis]